MFPESAGVAEGIIRTDTKQRTFLEDVQNSSTQSTDQTLFHHERQPKPHGSERTHVVSGVGSSGRTIVFLIGSRSATAQENSAQSK